MKEEEEVVVVVVRARGEEAAANQQRITDPRAMWECARGAAELVGCYIRAEAHACGTRTGVGQTASAAT